MPPKKKRSWLDRVVSVGKAVGEGVEKSGSKASKKRKRQKANCGGCD